MHIEKEFLHSDTNKFVTIPLLKTNYGFSSVLPNSNSESNASSLLSTTTIRVNQLLVIVPVMSSAVVYLMDRDSDTVAAIRSTAPGETSLTLPLVENKRYWIYVASKEYVNGYVRGDNTVQPNVSTQDRQTFTYEQQRDSLNLGAPNAMSLATDGNNPRQWYASDVYYDSPNLIWYLPSTTANLSSLENSWLIYRQSIYTTIANMLQQEDLLSFSETSQSNTVAKTKAIKTFKIMSDIAEYMQDNRRDIEDAIGLEDSLKLATTWDFLNAQLPGYGANGDDDPEYYRTYDLDMHNKLDMLAVHGDHVNMGTWDSNNNQELEYNGLTVAGTNTNKPLGVLTQEAMWNGLYQGGLRVRSFIAGRWSNIPWHADDGTVVWAPYGNAAISYKNEFMATLNGYNSILGSKELPIQSRAFNQHIEWWNSYIEIAKSKFNNLQEWLTTETANGWNDMVAAGSTLWPSGDREIVGTGPLRPEYSGTVTPSFMSPYSVPLEQRSSMPSFFASNDHRPMDDVPGHEDRWDWVWYYLKLHNWIPSDYASWDSARVYDISLSGIGVSPVYPSFGITESEWESVRDWITLNREQLWVITYTSMPSDTVTGETQQLAHNAVLQNIRFLRTLVEQVDDNLWATVNNTSVLLLNEFLSLADSVRTQVAAHTIVNLTSTNFNDGVDVMYAMEGLSNLPAWQNFTERVPLNSNLKTVRTLTLNDPVFSTIGRHLIQVHPKRVLVNVRSYNDRGVIHIPDSLNSYPQTSNYFYGWNIQFESLDGRNELGSQKVIVASTWNADGHFLQVSPFIPGEVVAINDEVRARIWSNAFIPVLISINIVEHNALTLSYSLYGDREFNTETGKAIIYDYTGRPFRTLTYGKLETDASNRDEIEFRYRAPSPEDPGRFLEGATWNDDVPRRGDG